MANVNGDVGQRNAASARSRLGQHQRGAGGGVDLAAMMRLGDFNIPLKGAQAPCSLFHDAGKHVDAQRKVSRTHHRDGLGGRDNRRALLSRETGRTDDQGRTAARGRLSRQGGGGGRAGKVDDHSACGQVLRRRPRPVKLRGEGKIRPRVHRPDDRLTHPSQCAGNADVKGSGHAGDPQASRLP